MHINCDLYEDKEDLSQLVSELTDLKDKLILKFGYDSPYESTVSETIDILEQIIDDSE